MHPIDTAASRFDCVEILGIPALFTVERVNRATVPEKLFAYDMQTSEDDWSIPCLIGHHITVEHYGTVITASPIPLPDTGYLDLVQGDFVQSKGGERLTLAEFAAKSLASDQRPRPSTTHAKMFRAHNAPTR